MSSMYHGCESGGLDTGLSTSTPTSQRPHFDPLCSFFFRNGPSDSAVANTFDRDGGVLL